MTANEFVRDYGFGEAKRVLHDARGCESIRLWGRYEFKNDDLKRLIESHELIESFGGLEMAKRFLNENIECEDSENLKQAIADVESCL